MRPEEYVQRIPPLRCVGDRASHVASLCVGKDVLHLGCAESPRTASALSDGSLLHLRIQSTASRVVGVDLDQEALGVLKKAGMTDLVHGDVERLEDLKLGNFDRVVAGEVIEHLSNPGLCFRGISSVLRNAESRVVITVPNAFSLRHQIPVALRRRELVMPDHTAYYSWSTLAEQLRRHGLRATDFLSYMNLGRHPGFRGAVGRGYSRTVLRAFPQLAEGIIVVAGKA